MTRQGAGIACVPEHLAAPDVASGRLVELFPGWRPPAVDVSAVFSSRRALSPAGRAFVDFLKQAFPASRFAG